MDAGKIRQALEEERCQRKPGDDPLLVQRGRFKIYGEHMTFCKSCMHDNMFLRIRAVFSLLAKSEAIDAGAEVDE